MSTRAQKYVLFIALMLVLFPACELIDVEPDSNDLRDKFIGTWKFNEDEKKKSDLAFYSVLISKDPTNSAQVLLKNFGNLGNFYTTYGIVTTNRISIENQLVVSIKISGTGTYSSTGIMNWTYTINDGADEITYTATAEKT
ncbi:MAG: hypothetical protein GX128_02780 [Bacteroidales bacterium]|jgi:hypothetical protein|nr:hypothetical protein [Bacteroidales bacterium]